MNFMKETRIRIRRTFTLALHQKSVIFGSHSEYIGNFLRLPEYIYSALIPNQKGLRDSDEYFGTLRKL
jgi:hypothetical protein